MIDGFYAKKMLKVENETAYEPNEFALLTDKADKNIQP